MKLIVTSKGETLQSPIDPRFGRAAQFILLDTETSQFACVSNTQNLNAPQGAGVQAAATVSRLGVACVITGHCGPKAFRALQAAGITVYATQAGTVAEAIEQFKSGTLVASESANVEGHWN